MRNTVKEADKMVFGRRPKIVLFATRAWIEKKPVAFRRSGVDAIYAISPLVSQLQHEGE
jgi:hypothetical protein